MHKQTRNTTNKNKLGTTNSNIKVEERNKHSQSNKFSNIQREQHHRRSVMHADWNTIFTEWTNQLTFLIFKVLVNFASSTYEINNRSIYALHLRTNMFLPKIDTMWYICLVETFVSNSSQHNTCTIQMFWLFSPKKFISMQPSRAIHHMLSYSADIALSWMKNCIITLKGRYVSQKMLCVFSSVINILI